PPRHAARVRRRCLLPGLRARRVRDRDDRARRRRALPRASVRRLLSPGLLLTVGLVLLAIVLAGFVIPSNDYLFLPDKAHPVAPLVTVAGGHDPAKGGIFFVDVIEKKASLIEKVFPSIHEGADLYPAKEVNPPGANDAQT